MTGRSGVMTVLRVGSIGSWWYSRRKFCTILVRAMCISCSANRLPIHMRAPWPQIRLDMLFCVVSMSEERSHLSGLKLELSGNRVSSRNMPNRLAWTWVPAGSRYPDTSSSSCRIRLVAHVIGYRSFCSGLKKVYRR